MANENPYHESKTRKYVKTACLCLAFLSLGLIMALPGPALPTLAYNIGIEIDAISFIFPSRAVGYLIGSIVSGVLHGKLDTYKMIGFSLMMTAIGFTSAPFFSSVILLAIAMTSMGISMGFLDTGGNVLCLEIWGDESGPFMQALHFSFALGATTAPFLAQPFIMEVVDTNATTNMTTAAMINNFTAATELSTTAVPPTRPGFPYVAWAFIICGSLTIMISIAFLYLSFSKRSKAASKQENTVKEEGFKFRMQVLILMFIFYLVYVGIEVTFGIYIFTFSIKSPKEYSKDQATMLNGIFWGSFAFGRFLCIFISKFLKPIGLLAVDLVGTFIAAVILVCFPYYYASSDYLFWIGVSIYGLSMASIFPTGLSYAEQYITINGKAAASLVIGGALGEMLLPLVVGQLIEEYPMNLMYAATTCMVITTCIFVILHCLTSSRGKRLSGKRRLRETATDPKEMARLTEEIDMKEIDL